MLVRACQGDSVASKEHNEQVGDARDYAGDGGWRQ